MPDWFLVAAAGALHFPDNGAWKIGGAVSVYMAGMWSIPLLWVLASCSTGTTSAPDLTQLLRAAAAAVLVFGAAEQLSVPLRLWSKTSIVKHTAGHVALYVLPAEAVLGAATLLACRATAGGAGWGAAARRLLAAAAVAIMYTGALAVSYLFVEVIT